MKMKMKLLLSALLLSALYAASGLLTSGLRSRAKSEPSLRHHSKSESRLCGLESSGLRLSAECCLSVHDSGGPDAGEKDSGDCECKNVVHSSLLELSCIACRLRLLYRVGSRFLSNDVFPADSTPRINF